MRQIDSVFWTRRRFGKNALGLLSAMSFSRALRSGAQLVSNPRASVSGPNSLRAHAAARGMLYGAAVNPALLDVDGLAAGATSDRYTQLLVDQSGIVVAENAMKWAALRPTPDTFDFTQADRLMRFAALASQRVRGHNLCWHEALPPWFAGYANKDNARKLLIDHIQAVAGHYRGQMHSWDVVNEAIEPKDGRPDGLRNSPWLELAGPDYIELAFQTAAAVDPGAKLTYNDYGIELDTAEQSAKRGAMLMLLRRLKARNIPIHAVGLQSHLQADGPEPGAGIVAFIRELKKMGLDVYITEMDVNTHSLEGGPMVQDVAVARVYRDYLNLVLAEPNVPIALTWGITSAHTWLNESHQPWARRPDGARQRPLPFDDSLQPTPAFTAIREAIDTARALAPLPLATPATTDPNDLFKPFPVQGSPTTQPQAAPTPPTGPS
jgi:endo-1,4-beta-xylanase